MPTALEKKMVMVFEAELRIEKSSNEQEAIFETMLCLEMLRYPSVMISLLQTVKEGKVIVGDPAFATGDKWKKIAMHTHRDYDHSPDIIALALRKKQSRFVLDSRIDPLGETDQMLCRELDLVTQYVVPLVTDSLNIGVLQVEMGSLSKQPVAECKMLDALAGHLSLAIERHRTLVQLESLNNAFVGQGQRAIFEAAAAQILHTLNHSIGDYAQRLRQAFQNPNIKQNKDACDFLKDTERRVIDWVSSLQRNVRFRCRTLCDVEDVVREAVEIWHHKAAVQRCRVACKFHARGMKVRQRVGELREILSCLIINSIEAHARHVEVTVKPAKTNPYSENVEISVSDDGQGISPDHREFLMSFGWSTKNGDGHGLGLKITDMLVKQMGGALWLASAGRASGEQHTEFVMSLPVAFDDQTDSK